ncbi:hypothetical protein F5876DRAFT_78722 [Lentinula aff. lateritia]|uniref:Uncharacterized protein n=1 Tax=Lentinula aff. lateritia TaxID=2804960 RepID=A0ACC1TVC7_9AGAR|nr:hypothetical protein F5876DRAFT_78722 [Lentinula aff. lateritia]
MHISILAIPFALTFLAAAAPFHQPRAGHSEQSSTKPSKSASAKHQQKHPKQKSKPALGAFTAGKCGSTSPSTNHNSQCTALTTITRSKTSHKSKRIDAQVQHPLGRSDAVLFHGTYREDHAAELQSEVDLSSIKHGDLHDVAVSGVDGGFYLTDSLLEAAQFACRNLEAKAYVLEYKWTGANLPVKEYQKGAEFTAFLDYDKHAEAPSRNAALDQIMADNDMITGPMTNKYADAFLTPYFRQYAVIKQRAATNNLKYTSTYEVPCTAVPVGKDLFAEYYTASQKSSPHFDELVKLLIQCEPGIGHWQEAVNAEKDA